MSGTDVLTIAGFAALVVVVLVEHRRERREKRNAYLVQGPHVMSPRLLWLLFLIVWTVITDSCAVKRKRTLLDEVRGVKPAADCGCPADCGCRKRFFLEPAPGADGS